MDRRSAAILAAHLRKASVIPAYALNLAESCARKLWARWACTKSAVCCRANVHESCQRRLRLRSASSCCCNDAALSCSLCTALFSATSTQHCTGISATPSCARSAR
eukprot:12838099-Alexandrium_andersonii.AAC.1